MKASAASTTFGEYSCCFRVPFINDWQNAFSENGQLTRLIRSKIESEVLLLLQSDPDYNSHSFIEAPLPYLPQGPTDDASSSQETAFTTRARHSRYPLRGQRIRASSPENRPGSERA